MSVLVCKTTETHLPLDALDDTPPDFSVTTNSGLVDNLHDDRADFPAEEINDTIDIVDHDIASDTFPAVDSIPATINASTNVVINLVTTPAQITAVNVIIAETNDLKQL